MATAGPPDGPLVLLLHGFPEFWYGWRHQMAPLAEAGFCVWAPDQRGYNLSDKPLAVASYAIEPLAADVLGLIDAAGRRRAVVVGHDWGGIVAWQLAGNSPECIERVVILNAPHPNVMFRQLFANPRQLLKSRYIAWFQTPWLPERWLGFHHGWPLARTLRRTSRAGAFSEADLALYREAWSQPGAMTGMIHWYRAAVRHRSSPVKARIEPPVLMIWGPQDRFLGQELAQPSIERCARGRLEFIEGATHWLHHERPERINELLVRFAAG
ncbi:MAG TPA: alpha/beta hydrolase [Pirellulales bacterium]|nr:alpha/beta hydrolase [Pirellulales bacterium]